MFELINGKSDNGVRKDVLRHPPLPSNMLVSETALGPDNKDGTNLFDEIESFEVTVCTVKKPYNFLPYNIFKELL
jgi:hypothetical protein